LKQKNKKQKLKKQTVKTKKGACILQAPLLPARVSDHPNRIGILPIPYFPSTSFILKSSSSTSTSCAGQRPCDSYCKYSRKIAQTVKAESCVGYWL
jgi:hypothetical protein